MSPLPCYNTVQEWGLHQSCGEGKLAMEGSIFVVQPDNSLVKVNRTPYNSEALLQGLLADYPDLLAGEQMNTENPRRWLLISQELKLPAEMDGTGGWWIDHFFLDQDAIPTIVEVKRSSDARIRREVIGQMLDYAAHLEVYWPAERIRAAFEERCRAKGIEPNEKVIELLQDDSSDVGVFWTRVGENLSIGKIRLIFVADEMPMHLQRVVEFLNKYMSPTEVLAVEIKQFEGSNLKTLVPRVLGQTAQAQQKSSASSATGPKIRWDESRFMTAIPKFNDSRVADAMNLIYERTKSIGVYWGEGKAENRGSYYPELTHDGVKHYMFGLWTSGDIELQFQRMIGKAPFDDWSLRRMLADRLQAIPGVGLLTDEVLVKRPSFPVASFSDSNALEKFLQVFDWYVETIRAS